MASTLKIKRSLNANAPGSLNTGELAVTFGVGAQNNSGDRVFVGGLGAGNDINGASGAPIVIGGKYFTDMMDHVHGTLTASSALIADANSKLDNLKVDNLDLNGNTISSTDSNGNIILDPNGTGDVVVSAGAELQVTDLTSGRVLFVGANGALVDNTNFTFNSGTGALEVTGSFQADNIKLDGNVISTTDTNGNLDLNPNGTGQVKIANTWYLPRGAGTANQVLTADGSGNATWASPVTTLNISGDSGSNTSIDLLSETLDLEGVGAISTTSVPASNKITFSIADATTTTKGAASFNTSNFTVSSGAVSSKSITLGSSTLDLGSTTTAIAGLTQLAVDNLDLNGNTISSTDSNGNITLDPNGTGDVVIATGAELQITDLTAGRMVFVGTSGALVDDGDLTYNSTSNTITVPNINVTTNATFASVTASDLTSGRVTFAGTSGKLEDDGDLTYNKTSNTLTVPNVSVGTEATLASAIISDLTAGRVTFAGTSGAVVDSADLTFNDSTDTLTVPNASVGTLATLASAKVSDLTSGRVTFAGTAGQLVDSANFTFNTGTGALSLTGDLTVDNININGSTISTVGATDLLLNTNGGTDSGFIKINDGVNGNIEISPNGTGQVIIGGQNWTAYNGDTWYVSADSGSNSNDGRRLNTAFLTIAYALTQAASGDTIQVLPGTYQEVFPLTVPAGITVRGAGVRATKITPTALTNTNDCFLLNGETTIEELTIADMRYNSGANTGYAFRYNTAAMVTVTSRSPYIRNVTVFNKGSGANSNDPYGFLSNNAGRGAYVDGSRVTRASLEAAMLFNECTFIVPNSRGLIMTNGARVEWLNCFTYFADLAIEGVVGAAGRGGDGKTRITFGNVTGAFQAGDVVTLDYVDSTDVTFTVESVENSGTTVVIDGSLNTLEGKDFTPAGGISGSISGASAVRVVRYDRGEFAAEMRSISSANVYGNQGVRADGDDVYIHLMAHNFAYIGTGADLTNNKSAVVQADEVIEANNGRVYYNSVDQSGNFRIGDYFSVDFATGNVTFNAPEFNVNNTTGFTFTSGANVTTISGNGVVANNITISGNTISSTSGNIYIDPTGNQDVIVDADTGINGVLTINNEYSFPTVDGTAGQALITDGNGNVTFTTISTTLSIAGDTGTDTVSLLTDTLTFSGGEGMDVAVTNNTVTISGENAASNNKGIASFSPSYFTVTSGDVAINDATTTTKGIASFNTSGFDLNTGAVSLKANVVQGITTDSGAMTITGNAVSVLGGEGMDVTHAGTSITIAGEDASSANKGIASFAASYFTVTSGDVAINDATTTTKGIASFDTNNFTVTTGAVSAKSITLGTTVLDLGSTDLTLAGLQQLDVDNIRVDGNEISSTDANGNISLNPNGTGTVDVNSARITSLGTPTQGTDAATKDYVDAARSGLDVKQSVRAASTGNLTLSNTQTVDGVALSVGDRVLAKDQTTASQNGVYVVANGAWTRATDFDEPYEVTAGVFFFVEEGTVNADNGFVITSNNPLVVGTDPLTFTQFSGAGQITAGDALTKTGNRLDVAVAANGGIEISADALQLKSTVAGDGLTYTSGVLNVVGTTDRITVSADAVDIASTYIGQNTITTLGTITTGTWNGSTVQAGYGGTGHTTYASGDLLYGNIGGSLSKLTMGAAGKFLQVNAAGTDLVYGDFDGGTF